MDSENTDFFLSAYRDINKGIDNLNNIDQLSSWLTSHSHLFFNASFVRIYVNSEVIQSILSPPIQQKFTNEKQSYILLNQLQSNPDFNSSSLNEHIQSGLIIDLKSNQYTPSYLVIGYNQLNLPLPQNIDYMLILSKLISTQLDRLTIQHKYRKLNEKFDELLKSIDHKQHDLEFVFNQIEDMVFVFNLDKQFIYINPPALKKLGFSKQEIMQKSIVDLYPPQYRKNVDIYFNKVLTNQKQSWHFPLITKDNKFIPSETTGIQAHWDSTGVLICISKDISAREKAESALQTEHEQMLSIFDSIDELVTIIDPETDKIIFANQIIREQFGEVIGETCYKFIQNQDSHCDFCSNKHIFGENLGNVYIWEHFNKQTKRWYRNYNKAIQWPDSKWVRYELAIDITNQKQADEEKKIHNIELSLQNDLAYEFLNSDDKQLHQNLLNKIQKVLSSPYAIFGYIDQKGDLILSTYRLSSSQNVEPVDSNFKISPDKWGGIWGKSLKEKTAIYRNNNLHPPQDHLPVKNCLCSPIIYQNDIIGMIMVANKKENYNDTDLRILVNTCSYIAPLMISRSQKKNEEVEKLKVQQELTFKIEFEQLIRSFSTDFVNISSDQTDQAIEQALGKIGKFLKVDRGYIFTFFNNLSSMDKTHQWFSPHYQTKKVPLVNISTKNIPWFIRKLKNFETVNIHDVDEMPSEADIEKILLESQNIKSMILIPMIYQGSLIGFVGFDSLNKNIYFKQQAVGLLVVVAEIFSNLLQRKVFEEDLKNAKVKAELATKAKSEFLANMSHEIRTPLNGIFGMLNLLEDTELSDEQQEYIEMAKISSESLLAIVNEVLDFSKIEAGKIRLDKKPFNFETEISLLMETFSKAAQEKGIELIVRYDLKGPKILIGDNFRIRQILFNLVGNAVKFTEKGYIWVNAECKEIKNNFANFLISVKDTGIGIPSDKKEKVFEHFSQADNSTTRKFQGSGLGLAISKKLVNMMGGEISLESTEGKGSTFSFTLSLEIGPKTEPEDYSTDKLVGVKTLVVDDNPINLRIFSEYLASWGMIFSTFEDSQEGLDELHQAYHQGEPYQLALLDYLMPGMDGEQLGKLIKSDPCLNSTILILISSSGVQDKFDRLKESGFAAYLSKPISRPDLAITMISALETSSNNQYQIHRKFQSHIQPQKSQTNRQSLSSTILLVEDNKISQQAAYKMLQKMGCNVEIAENGLTALDITKNKSADYFDLIFMDIQMPEMDGYQATQEIRKLSPNYKHIPIIAMTAHVLPGEKEKCLNFGMDDYIGKPISGDILYNKIKKWTTPRQFSSNSEKHTTTPYKGVSDILDIDAALKRFDGEIDILKELIVMFVEVSEQDLAKLEQQLETSDFDQAAKTAHSIKGGAANIGANQISDVLVELELLAKHNNKEECKNLMKKIKILFDNLKIEVDNMGWK
ncbi:MAG: hypothetical protein APR63_06320 [Desulfuromonas sp. SDB]|nr:MAG: hypothetical protein APR63_06320 [Desulfuromonas sp. SDB]